MRIFIQSFGDEVIKLSSLESAAENIAPYIAGASIGGLVGHAALRYGSLGALAGIAVVKKIKDLSDNKKNTGKTS
jgi:hypothetical protein